MDALILNHLQEYGSITGAEAYLMYKSRSTTRRIATLRKQGHDIYSEWRKDATGQRYVRYWLRKKTPVVDHLRLSSTLLRTASRESVLKALSEPTYLIMAFQWDHSPQGAEHWANRYDLHEPYTDADREFLTLLAKKGYQE